MYGVMGLVNAERHLEYIRSLTEFLVPRGDQGGCPDVRRASVTARHGIDAWWLG